MNRKAIKWLYGELPDLVGRGVVPGETAAKIRDYYGEAETHAGRKIALTVCSILGAVLIGAGVILLLAHNWDELSRPLRTALALAPLAASQAAGVWLLASGRRSAAWREGTAAFMALAVGASIALVAQTYNMPGDSGSFVLTWMLLLLPVIYLLDAAVPCVFYLAGITSWAGCEQGHGGYAIAFWLLLALALPYLGKQVRRNPYSPAAAVLGWTLSICVCVGMGIVLSDVLSDTWIILYGALLAVLYLAGSRWFRNAPAPWQNPLHAVGAAGIAGLALLLTFDWPWKETSSPSHALLLNLQKPEAYLALAVLALLWGAAAVLIATARRSGQTGRLAYGVMPLAALAGYGLNAWHGALAATVLFDLYLLSLGVCTLVAGIRRSRIGTVNAGMLVVAALVVARFFDSELGFVVRGLAFVAVGIGFLVTNLVLMKRMKGGAL
jgi:uncharacterized membrane protein